LRRRWWLAAIAVLLVVAGGVGVGVLMPRWRAAQAERARLERRAEAARVLAAAERAIDRAAGPGPATAPERAAAATEASQHLARLREGLDLEPALVPRVAETLRRLADLTAGAAEPTPAAQARALGLYDESLRLLDAAAPGTGTAVGAARTRARALAGRARLLDALERRDEARAEYLRAAEAARALAGQPTRDSADAELLAGIEAALAEGLRDDGDAKGALARYEEAIRLLEAPGAPAGDPGRQRWLLRLRLEAAGMHAAIGDLDAARDTYAATSALATDLDAGVSWSDSVTRGVALGLVRVGSLRERGGDRKGRGDIQAGARMLRERARRDVGDVEVQRDLLGALVALGDVLAGDSPERAREIYREAWAVADALAGAAAPDPATAQTLKAVETKLRAGPAAWIPRPQIELLLLGEGEPLALGPDAADLQEGEELVVRTKTPAGSVGYLLLFGGGGPARLLAEAEVRAEDGRVTIAGPPPSQTVLLLASSRPLSRDERAALLDAIRQIAGPRTLPGARHLRWRDGVPVAAEGGAAGTDASSLDWTVAIRRALGRFPQIAYAGRTFPLSGSQ